MLYKKFLRYLNFLLINYNYNDQSHVIILILLREIDSKAAMQIIIIKLNFLINFFN